MFNAVRVTAIIAIMAVGGSLALVTGPLGPAGLPVTAPAGAPETLDAAEFGGFSGRWTGFPVADGETTSTDWGRMVRGETWSSPITLSDPRISGTFSSIHDYNAFSPGTRFGVRAVDNLIENDQGSWSGTGRGFQMPGSGVMHYEVELTGSGAYEGLTALMILSQDAFSMTFDIEGVIFPGSLPDYPAWEVPVE